MEFITEFFGRLHPLLVHLPIGILLLAFVFEFISKWKRFKKLNNAVQPALLLGSLSAVASALSGYLLSQEGGYDENLLQWHQNMGIATAVFSVLVYFIRGNIGYFLKEKGSRKLFRIFIFIPLVILLSFTGHLGGSITHGEDYLFGHTSSSDLHSSSIKIKAITNLDEAILFQDVVKPILEEKCFTCHSSRKQKGNLRLDSEEAILKGGKDGKVIGGAIADSAELYKRLVLPVEDKHHMPPEEKSQLNSAEITLIHAWLSEGATFNKKIIALQDPERVKRFVKVLQEEFISESLVPDKEVSPADQKTMDKLKSMGVLVLPMSASSSNYLMVNFIESNVKDNEVELLLPLKDQLVSLKLSNTHVTDEAVKILSKLTNLRKLSLDNTVITDLSLNSLVQLSNLSYLNLVGTAVTDSGVLVLGGMKNLKQLYLYQTKVTREAIKALQEKLPTLQIDSGKYELPQLPTDTIIFKRKA